VIRAKEARKRFERGFSCAPAVLSAYCEQLGLQEALALKIACGFGGGIGRTGRTCGAVTGAIMAIGLKYGQADLADEEARQKTHELAAEFIKRFTALHGSIECRELIGYDLSDPEQLELARASQDRHNTCERLVYGSAQILEDVLHLQ